MDIKEARTYQLVDELKLRCPAGVVILSVPDDGNVTDSYLTTWGNRLWVIGACSAAAAMRTKILIDTSEAPEPEEPDGTDQL